MEQKGEGKKGKGSDPGGCQAADEGDAAEAHPSEEGGAGGLHGKVLQEDPQLGEQGAAVGVSSGCITKSEESVVNERQQQTSLATEEHKYSGGHEKDLIAGDELQDVLLICCQLIKQISDKHQTVGPHGIKNFFCVGRCMKQGEEKDWENAHCDGVGVDQDERVEQIMAAVLLKSLLQERPAQLEAWKSLVQAQGTGEGIC